MTCTVRYTILGFLYHEAEKNVRIKSANNLLVGRYDKFESDLLYIEKIKKDSNTTGEEMVTILKIKEIFKK